MNGARPGPAAGSAARRSAGPSVVRAAGTAGHREPRPPEPGTAVSAPADAVPGTLPGVLQALLGHRPPRTSVWFMRQAGRSLPEYRALRARSGESMLDACLDPDVAVEATLQPVRRHGVDAAVLFSDIMVPLLLAGVDVDIVAGTGPVLAHPVRTARDVAELVGRGTDLTARPGGLEAVTTAVRRCVSELGSPAAVPGPAAPTAPTAPAAVPLPVHPVPGPGPAAPAAPSLPEPPRRGGDPAGWTPLIGFGGAPFTLAAYMVAGRPSRDQLEARTMMHADPPSWDRLMTWCAEVTGAFIAAQVRAGASAAQLFDSWAGSLPLDDYRRRVAPYSALAIDRARAVVSPTTGRRAPLVHFGTGTGELLAAMREAGGDAIGVDERLPLDVASERLGGDVPLQGNIDPSYLGAPTDVLDAHVAEVLERGRSAPAHVVNLGHGVPPDTDPDVLTHIVQEVHAS